MTLLLEHGPNPDIPGGYWNGIPSTPETQTVEVENLAEGRKTLREWIESHDLGAGNMTRNCGKIYNQNVLVGRFSYNGRLWDETQKELPIP